MSVGDVVPVKLLFARFGGLCRGRRPCKTAICPLRRASFSMKRSRIARPSIHIQMLGSYWRKIIRRVMQDWRNSLR
jgi:hypothetical protein